MPDWMRPFTSCVAEMDWKEKELRRRQVVCMFHKMNNSLEVYTVLLISHSQAALKDSSVHKKNLHRSELKAPAEIKIIC